MPSNFSLGSDYILFVTNSKGSLTESNTTNDIDALPITLSAPDVDLAIASPSSSLTTAEAGNGQDVDLSWTVYNFGTTDAAAVRTDAVYLANATTLGTATESWQIASVETSEQPPVGGGSNATETATGSIPNVPAGSYDLVYVANDQGTSTFGAQSETSTANDSTFLPITITRPSVDLKLHMASLSTSSTITEGSQVQVNYAVENVGAGAAQGTWNDSIYLSDTPSPNSGSNSQLLGSFPSLASSVPLGSEASYTNQAAVTIPRASTGSQYLIVVTNDGDFQAETDDPTDSNDSFAIPITLNAPDLTAAIISSPSSAIEGDLVPVTYTVTNQGPVATVSDWSDSVYLSPTPMFDAATATFMNAFATSSLGESDLAPLAAGASYTRTVDVPILAVAIGTQYLVVIADDESVSQNGIYQFQPDADLSNNATSAAIVLSAPDLTITTATASGSAIEGEPISVSWTVQNIGDTPARANWSDAIFVSSSQELDDTATLVASFDEGTQSPMAANASYTAAESFVLLPAPTGSEYLIFVTNYYAIEKMLYDGAQGETDYVNNTYAVPITVRAPDLTITTASAPLSLIEAQSIDVSWTVQNAGAVQAPADWYDAVFVGSSPTFDEGDDTFLGDFSESGRSPLAAGASYTEHESLFTPPAPTRRVPDLRYQLSHC